MCGICGWVGGTDSAEGARKRLEESMTMLAHRGPEGEGSHLEDGVALGFRRLRIVDLEGGDQPLTNEDGRLALVLNGEVYNAPELREELEGRGHRFRTLSDAEPVLHLYEDEGLGFVHRLRGMFALALWDRVNRRLVLARDRLGIKPLCVARFPGGLAFGSEAKAILATGWMDRHLDTEALRQLFAFGFVLTPRTLFRGVENLPPGHLMVVEDSREPRVERYWEPEFPDRDGYEHRPPEEWAEELLATLTESVRIHLRSDVPVGAWLSSGLDSSTVVAMMTALDVPPADVVSLAFEAPECDEVGTTPTLSQLGVELPARTIRCSQSDVGLLPEAAWYSEAPTLAGLEVPRLLLSRASSERVKVVLTGEGSDELLGGYRWYHGQRVLGPLARLPRPLRWLASGGPMGRRFRPRTAAVLLAPAEMDLERLRAMVAADLWGEAAKVLPELGETPPVWKLDPPPPEGFSRWHPFCQLQYLDMRVRLPNFVIHTLDRGAMACGLEARVPFLDPHLVELAARIPPRVKMRGLMEKHVLRQAVRGLVPEPVRLRRKRGMETPTESWFRGDLPAPVAWALDPRNVADCAIFEPTAVAGLLARHRRGEIDGGRVLVGVVGVQTVVRRLMRGADR